MSRSVAHACTFLVAALAMMLGAAPLQAQTVSPPKSPEAAARKARVERTQALEAQTLQLAQEVGAIHYRIKKMRSVALKTDKDLQQLQQQRDAVTEKLEQALLAKVDGLADLVNKKEALIAEHDKLRAELAELRTPKKAE